MSGFGEYVVIWNLAQVIRGDVDNYKFTRIDGELVQTDFMFDNVRKLIMTTNTGIVIKENKVKSWFVSSLVYWLKIIIWWSLTKFLMCRLYYLFVLNLTLMLVLLVDLPWLGLIPTLSRYVGAPRFRWTLSSWWGQFWVGS